MMLKIINAKYENEYRIWLQFDDGFSGVVDLEADLWGPIFEPLRDVQEFMKFRVSELFHTLVWENGADLAPEHLRRKVVSDSQVA